MSLRVFGKDQILRGRYRLEDELSPGGFGQVWKAEDKHLTTSVAVKIFAPSGSHTQQTLARLKEKFAEEAKRLASLSHHYLPTARDYFIEGDTPFLIMDFVPGKNLKETLQTGNQNKPFELEEVLDWTDQLLEVLIYLHSQDTPVVHRDIKPANLKLSLHRKIILLDFGISKGTVDDQTTLDDTKSIAGISESYSPLEQGLKANPDWQKQLKAIDRDRVRNIVDSLQSCPQTDLFSLGATIYCLLSGEPPEFNACVRASRIWEGKPDPLPILQTVNTNVPSLISDFVHRALELEIDDRFSSSEEMRLRLLQIRDTERLETEKAERKKLIAEIKSEYDLQISNRDQTINIHKSKHERLLQDITEIKGRMFVSEQTFEFEKSKWFTEEKKLRKDLGNLRRPFERETIVLPNRGLLGDGLSPVAKNKTRLDHQNEGLAHDTIEQTNGQTNFVTIEKEPSWSGRVISVVMLLFLGSIIGLSGGYLLTDRADASLSAQTSTVAKSTNEEEEQGEEEAKKYYFSGEKKAKSGNYKGAIDDYTEAIRLNPNYSDAFFGRAYNGDASKLVTPQQIIRFC
jgi:serine/threonine protein kinase